MLHLSLSPPFKARAIHWIVLSAAILAVDYATGPFIQFPILFVFVVALATAAHGRRIGVIIATLLPVLRVTFFLRWTLPASWPLEIIDTAVDMAILAATSVLIDKMLRQERELQVLEGLLPICSFCKRIRDEDGHWRQLETYISSHSSARFSHTFCRDCGQKEYPGLME